MSPPSSEAVIHVLCCTRDYSKVMYDLIIVKCLAFPIFKIVFLYSANLVSYLRGDFYIANDHILVFFLFFRKILIPFTSIFLWNLFVFLISSRWILPFIFKSSFILFNYRCHCNLIILTQSRWFIHQTILYQKSFYPKYQKKFQNHHYYIPLSYFYLRMYSHFLKPLRVIVLTTA